MYFGLSNNHIMCVHLFPRKILPSAFISPVLNSTTGCLILKNQPIFKTMTSVGLNSLRQKGYLISVKKMNFWWSIPQKGTGIGHLGARDDQIIRISIFWWNETVEVIEVIEAAEVLRPGNSLLKTSNSPRHLKLALYLCFEKKNVFGVESWNMYNIEF